MGIFGNKHQNNQVQQDEPLNIPAAAATAPTGAGSIDGVISTYQEPIALPTTPDPTNIGAPPVSSQPATPAGDYIMADPATPQVAAWGATDHQHDIIDTKSNLTSTPSVETAPEVPSQLEPTIDPFEAARSVPSTHPLPSHSSDMPEDLASIKEQALRELSPLVSHLDQSPEERFHTAMMMLQATDDHSLVKPAYDAAQAIVDEKTRAQALLDIVNEINYFTQQKS